MNKVLECFRTLQYSQLRSPDHCSFTVLSPYFYRAFTVLQMNH